MKVGRICESALVIQIIIQVAALLMCATVFSGHSGDAFQNNHFSPFIGPSSVADSFSFFNRRNEQIQSEPNGEGLDLFPMASIQQNYSTDIPPPTTDTNSTKPQSVPLTKADIPNQTPDPILLQSVISDFYEVPQHPLLTTSTQVPSTEDTKAAHSQIPEVVNVPISTTTPAPVSKSAINPALHTDHGYPALHTDHGYPIPHASENQTSSDKCQPQV